MSCNMCFTVVLICLEITANKKFLVVIHSLACGGRGMFITDNKIPSLYVRYKSVFNSTLGYPGEGPGLPGTPLGLAQRQFVSGGVLATGEAFGIHGGVAPLSISSAAVSVPTTPRRDNAAREGRHDRGEG